MLRSLSTLVFLGLLAIPAAGVAEIVQIDPVLQCTSNQHVDLSGNCACNSSADVMVDFECVPNPLFTIGHLFPDIIIDSCQFLGGCGGGGGSGGDPSPEPEPEEAEECLFADEDGNTQSCEERWNECGSEGFSASKTCEFTFTGGKCNTAPGAMEFPDGSSPTCEIVNQTGTILCTFPNPFQNKPFVGDLGGLMERCTEAWEESGDLPGETRECRNEALEEMGECQNTVVLECALEECGFEPPPATIQAGGPVDDQEPELGLFLRTKVRTRGQTAIGAEAFVRNATKTTCYWHLTADRTLPPEGTLYCQAGDRWEDVGSSRFLMADGDSYLADGACGVATQDGVASGGATFHWKVERDVTGALLDAKMKSVAGHVVGSLDGAHPYYGDCKVTGKAIEERQVPAGLLELVRER